MGVQSAWLEKGVSSSVGPNSSWLELNKRDQGLPTTLLSHAAECSQLRLSQVILAITRADMRKVGGRECCSTIILMWDYTEVHSYLIHVHQGSSSSKGLGSALPWATPEKATGPLQLHTRPPQPPWVPLLQLHCGFTLSSPSHTALYCPTP